MNDYVSRMIDGAMSLLNPIGDTAQYLFNTYIIILHNIVHLSIITTRGGIYACRNGCNLF